MLKKSIIVLLVIVMTALILIIFAKPIMKIIYKIDYSQYVEKYAKEYNIDKYLIYAIIKNESNFNSKAISNQDAKGLMQIMHNTGEEIANKLNIENELYNEETNIQLGAYYLSQLIQKYNNYLLAIAAYNAGMGNVDAWINKGIINADGSNIENIPIKETNNYVRKVFRDYNLYTKLYE